MNSEKIDDRLTINFSICIFDKYILDTLSHIVLDIYFHKNFVNEFKFDEKRKYIYFRLFQKFLSNKNYKINITDYNTVVNNTKNKIFDDDPKRFRALIDHKETVTKDDYKKFKEEIINYKFIINTTTSILNLMYNRINIDIIKDIISVADDLKFLRNNNFGIVNSHEKMYRVYPFKLKRDVRTKGLKICHKKGYMKQ